MTPEEGRRLESLVRTLWTGEGGIRGFCRAVGITPEALYKWFRGDNYPSLEHLTEMARTLGTTRAEIVAVMDGFDLAAVRRDQVAEEVEAAVAPLRQLLRDAGLLRGDGVLDGGSHGALR